MSNARNLARLIVDSGGDLDAGNLGNAINAGTVAYLGMSTAPTGWLKANGAAISRTTYAALFTAIGTTYGAGDGSTTFNIPDLRGEFPRGWDDGRGVDSGRAFGSAQTDQLQRITGQFTGSLLTTNSGTAVANKAGAFNVSPTWAISEQTGLNLYQTGQGSGVSQRYGFDSGASPDARVSSTTSGETRARNVALLACIKY